MKMKMILMRRLSCVLLLGAIAVLSQACKSSDDEEKEVVVPTPDEEVIKVELDRYLEETGLYFGDFWKEGYGNYYFELANGEVGLASEIETVPLNPGDYILSLDMWGDLSEDHALPILPEGVYTASQGRADHTFNLQHTLAIFNREQVGTQFRIDYIRFTDGTVTVKHVAEGYEIRARLETEAGQVYDFSYTGTVDMTDWSNDEEERWEIGHDVTVAPTAVTKVKWEDPEGDNYFLRCFDTEITDDGLHCKNPGTKLQISLWVERGADFVGTFTVGQRKVPGQIGPGERFGMGAFDSYCEQVLPNLEVRYCLISGGSLRIDRNADDTYTFDADFTTEDGFTVKGRWTLPVEVFTVRESAQTTLTEDVVFNPIQCSEIRHFGDYYHTETSNYTLFLADEDEILGLDLCAPKSDGTRFPTGTFTVADTYAANTLVPGSVTAENAVPSCYIRYNLETGDAQAVAPIVGGTLTVTEANGLYTFEYEFYDDYNRTDESLQPHKISGRWTGALPTILQGDEGLSASSLVAGASSVRTMRRTGKRVVLTR